MRIISYYSSDNGGVAAATPAEIAAEDPRHLARLVAARVDACQVVGVRLQPGDGTDYRFNLFRDLHVVSSPADGALFVVGSGRWCTVRVSPDGLLDEFTPWLNAWHLGVAVELAKLVVAVSRSEAYEGPTAYDWRWASPTKATIDVAASNCPGGGI